MKYFVLSLLLSISLFSAEIQSLIKYKGLTMANSNRYFATAYFYKNLEDKKETFKCQFDSFFDYKTTNERTNERSGLEKCTYIRPFESSTIDYETYAINVYESKNEIYKVKVRNQKEEKNQQFFWMKIVSDKIQVVDYLTEFLSSGEYALSKEWDHNYFEKADFKSKKFRMKDKMAEIKEEAIFISPKTSKLITAYKHFWGDEEVFQFDQLNIFKWLLVLESEEKEAEYIIPVIQEKKGRFQVLVGDHHQYEYFSKKVKDIAVLEWSFWGPSIWIDKKWFDKVESPSQKQKDKMYSLIEKQESLQAPEITVLKKTKVNGKYWFELNYQIASNCVYDRAKLPSIKLWVPLFDKDGKLNFKAWSKSNSC